MLARTLGYGLSGVSGFAVKVEVYAATGMPALEIIGLPDASVKESRDRVSAAIVNSGFTMPISRLTVNLAPADQRKEGPAFDLPIAISILMASGQLEGMDLTQTLMLGELSLDGSLHPVRGALPMVISASEQGIVDIILPEGNAEEVACIQGLRVYPANSLRQVVNHLKGRESIPVQQQRQYSDVVSAVKCAVDMAQVQGQVGARRALEVAASGGHNLLMVGTPGSGKTMLARCLPGILPPLTFSESLETTRIHSIAGRLAPGTGLMAERPFCAPHHSASVASMIGGGSNAKPGEVSLAHNGVLFLDEIGELHPVQMNKLLKVLEDRRVMLDSAYYNPDDATIPRYIHDIFHNGLPADFRLVGATTRSPSEISPALRSRCMEVFFRALTPEEIALIASGAAERAGCAMAKQEAETIGRYAACGRDAVNIVQMCAGLAQMDERTMILPEDVAWVVQSGHYTIHAQQKADVSNRVGVVHGLAVYGENQGALLDLEAVATPGNGKITVTGIIDEEEIGQEGHKMRRRSTANGAAENVRTWLKSLGYTLENTDLHINFPGGMPVDGPSAGVAMAVAAVSALSDTPVDGTMAVTGEITVQGKVKAVGGVPQKVEAACQAGLLRVLIPKENDAETLHIAGIEVQGIDDVHQALSAMLVHTKTEKKPIHRPLPMPEKVAAAAAEPSA